MEYNLLKTIESSFRANFVPNEQYPRLSPFPATDYVNPGVGQICRLHSFYVPLYTRQNLHEKQKKNAIENLEGSGEDHEEQKQNEAISEELKDNEHDLKDPIEFNLEKRKRLGSAIQESFLHPKLIKTDKIIFKKPAVKKELNSEQTVKKPVLSEKSLKHKFKFID